MTKNTVPRGGVIPTSQPASPKYCIFGAGAVGGTIAAIPPRHLTSVVKSMPRMRNDRGSPYYSLYLRGSTAAPQTGDRELAAVERERFNQYA